MPSRRLDLPAGRLRRLAARLRRTPLHPQWLMGSREPAARWVADVARGRVVDVGCADRWIEARLDPSCDYLGIDYPPTGERLYGARPNVFADASALPLATGCADTMMLLEVLEHVRDPGAALDECARLLRPGGRLCLSMPMMYPLHDAPHDYQRLTAPGLRRDLEARGFDIERLEPQLHAIASAGLLACLALSGSFLEALEKRSPAVLLLPLLLLIPLINVASWVLAVLLPHWPAMSTGFRVQARRR